MRGTLLSRTGARSPVAALPRLVLLLLVLLVAAACAQGSREAEPPEIHYGEDICADCGMIISEPRFASAYAWEIEQGRFESIAFDDIGDMVNAIKINQELPFVGFWAHDYYEETWIDAESAFYVVSTAIRSPMGHGVAAFSSQQDAAKLAAPLNAEVVDWDHMRIAVLLHNH